MGGAGALFPSSISMHEMEIENGNKSSVFSSSAARVPSQDAPPWPSQEEGGARELCWDVGRRRKC